MTEYFELLAVVEAVAAGDMTRESMIELAKGCLCRIDPDGDVPDDAIPPQTVLYLRDLKSLSGMIEAQAQHGDQCGPDCPEDCMFAP